MNLVLFAIMNILTVLTAMTIKGAVKNSDSLDRNAFIFILLAISSVWWTICFGAIVVCEDFEIAYILRTVGMIGTFAYLITGTILIAAWTKLKRWWIHGMVIFSFAGVFIYPLSVKKELIVFHKTSIGTTYSFLSSMETNVYTAYSVLIALFMYVMLIYAIKITNKRRMKVMGKQLLGGLTVISLGMVFDTVLPLFGLPAVPSSTISQSLGVMLMHRAFSYDRRNQLSMANMVNYAQYSVEVFVLAYDSDLNLKLISESARNFMSLSPDDEYKISDLFDLPKEKYLIDGVSSQMDAVCTKNGITCSLGIQKVVDEFDDIIGYAVTVTDITAKMEYIKEIEEAKRQADEANQSKSVFLAQMSHEIRTPLSAVLGMNEMILRETDINEIYKNAENIQTAGKSLVSIIDDILDLSKIESGKMRIIESDYNVAKAVRTLFNIVTYRAQKKGLQFKIEVDENLPSELCGDELRIRQIMLNLVNNAIKYTKVGWVKVKLCYEDLGDGKINMIAHVEDTGIGIKKEDMPRLFERFQRFDEKANYNVEGSGLGLSIVYNLVSLMEGDIEVKSVYERGSIFSIKIPQKVVNSKPVGIFSLEEQEEDIKEIQSFDAPEARIFAVDDNLVNLTIVKGLLKRNKMQVDTVSDGHSCLMKVRNEKYHVILLDHMMPEMDGIQVLHELKRMEDNKSKDAAIIALTANAIAGAKDEYLRHGFDDYLSKPIDPIKLEDTIKRYLPTEIIK